MTDQEKSSAAKKYLLQIRNMQQEIDKLDEIIFEKGESLSLPAFSMKERVSGTRKFDTFAEKVAAHLDLQMKRDDLMFRMLVRRDVIVDKILLIEGLIYPRVLYEYYIKGGTVKDVAKRINLSRQRVQHLKEEALEAFYDRWLSPGPHPMPKNTAEFVEMSLQVTEEDPEEECSGPED